ncbi:hypothetical protein [Streptomyces sp. NPDC003006]
MTDADEAQERERMRLLPWASPEGRPCYLDTDDPRSLLSLLADEVEEAQLSSGCEVLMGSEAVLADAMAGERAIRFALTRTTESLREALRIAHSRGDRVQS